MKRRHNFVAILIGLGILLGVAGNFVSNLVSSSRRIENALTPQWLLGLFVLDITGTFVVGMWLARLQGDQTGKDPYRRSIARQRETVALVILGEVLAGAGGVLSNLAADTASTQGIPDTLVLGIFLALMLLAIGGGLLLNWLQNEPLEEPTNRRRFLRKLQGRYSLRQEDALHGADVIALGLQASPLDVTRPPLLLGTLTDQQQFTATRELAPTTDLVQVYAESDGHLLVLGAPGAGKTTLLVALGLELLRHAQADPGAPMPVLFTLSTWAINHLPFEAWLIEDLVETYQVPRPLARAWVRTQQILPLLDGLDEVEEAWRSGCIEAIDAFQATQPQVPVVVCSRLVEYRAQRARLSLPTAVEVQPLADTQIAAYLTAGGERLAALRAAVAVDTDLREVMRTPLFLSLVTLTYQDLPREVIPPVTDAAVWRQQLFQDYVARMLERQRRLEGSAPYTSDETERYLAWVAEQMRAHGLSELYLERMQPDWLPSARARRSYRMHLGGVLGLAFGLVVGLAAGLLYWPTGGSKGGLVAASIGFAVGLAFGLVFGLGREAHAGPSVFPPARWSWRGMAHGALALGVGAAVITGSSLSVMGLNIWLPVALLFCSTFGLGGGMLFGLLGSQITGPRRGAGIGLLTGLLLST